MNADLQENPTALTIGEFMRIFPDTPFALHYVRRVTPDVRRTRDDDYIFGRGDSKFGWHASLTTNYWTFDTDQPLYHHQPPKDEEGHVHDGWGETPEEALGKMVHSFINAKHKYAVNAQKLAQTASDAYRMIADAYGKVRLQK